MAEPARARLHRAGEGVPAREDLAQAELPLVSWRLQGRPQRWLGTSSHQAKTSKSRFLEGGMTADSSLDVYSRTVAGVMITDVRSALDHRLLVHVYRPAYRDLAPAFR